MPAASVFLFLSLSHFVWGKTSLDSVKFLEIPCGSQPESQGNKKRTLWNSLCVIGWFFRSKPVGILESLSQRDVRFTITSFIQTTKYGDKYDKWLEDEEASWLSRIWTDLLNKQNHHDTMFSTCIVLYYCLWSSNVGKLDLIEEYFPNSALFVDNLIEIKRWRYGHNPQTSRG